MPQPTTTPAAEPPPKRARPPAETPPPGTDASAPKPAEEGAIFHALLDAGVQARVAYTAEKRMHAMTAQTVAEHTQPILLEIRQLATASAERHRTLAAEIQALKEAVAAHDRKLDVLAAQMRLVIGGFGLLVTALIAVFGILFTR